MSSASTAGTPKFSNVSMRTNSAPESTEGMTIGSVIVRNVRARRRAETLGRLLDGDVDRLEPGNRGQQHVRIECQSVDGDDAGHAVDGAERNAPGIEELRDDTRTAEQQQQRIGADEGRQHKGECRQTDRAEACRGCRAWQWRRRAALQSAR